MLAAMAAAAAQRVRRCVRVWWQMACEWCGAVGECSNAERVWMFVHATEGDVTADAGEEWRSGMREVWDMVQLCVSGGEAISLEAAYNALVEGVPARERAREGWKAAVCMLETMFGAQCLTEMAAHVPAGQLGEMSLLPDACQKVVAVACVLVGKGALLDDVQEGANVVAQYASQVLEARGTGLVVRVKCMRAVRAWCEKLRSG